MVVTPAGDRVGLGPRFVVLVFHQVDPVVWDARPVFVLLGHDVLGVFLLGFGVDPGTVRVVGVRPGVVVVERFAVDCTAGHGVCEAWVAGGTVVGLVRAVEQVLLSGLVVARAGGQDCRGAGDFFVFGIQGVVCFFGGRFFLLVVLPRFDHVCWGFGFKLFFSVSSLSS